MPSDSTQVISEKVNDIIPASDKAVDVADWFEKFLLDWGVNVKYAHYIELITFCIALILVCIIANFITKRIVLRAVEKFSEHSKNSWDDILVEQKVFRAISQIVPALIIRYSQPYVFRNFDHLIPHINRLTNIYIEIIIAMTLIYFTRAITEVVKRSPEYKDKPVDSFRQLASMLIYIALSILVIAEIANIEPMAIITGLGAVMVVVVLVFRDALLGFTASIQIASNDMLHNGDWVSFEKYGADGNVTEINLTTVKIQNWDKTISTVPTYAFISEAFKNWRGMEESGGRRISRSINIDMNSVKFMDTRLLEKTAKFHQITDYVEKKRKEIESYNKEHNVDASILANGRRMTNLGTFRAYLETYLRNKKEINHDMTFLVRQLAPSELGIPIQIYVFSKEQRWAQYEAIQADIFDHIIAVIPEFELRVFQNPTGIDFRAISQN